MEMGPHLEMIRHRVRAHTINSYFRPHRLVRAQKFEIFPHHGVSPEPSMA